MARQWFIRRGDAEQEGPFSSDDLRESATAGTLSPDDLVWKDGLAEWVPASRVKGLFAKAPAAAGGPVAPPPPPPAPPAPPASGGRRASQPPPQPAVDLVARHLADLLKSAVPSLAARCSSLLQAGKIPPKKLDGARQYCDRASGPDVHLLFDSTVFGTGSEGFLLLADGIAWRGPGGGAGGWKRFEQLDPATLGFVVETGVLGAKYLHLGKGDANRVRCTSLDPATLDELTTLLYRAARIGRGIDPRLLREKAKLAASEGRFDAASKDWTRAAEDPDSLAGEIIDDVRSAIQKHDSPEPLQRLLEELTAKAADRSARWSLKRRGARFSELASASEIAELWTTGQLFHDDEIRHFGDTSWSSAGDCEHVAALPTAYFRDTGHYDPKAFAIAVQRIQQLANGRRPLFCGPVGDDAGKRMHVCLFDDEELIRVQVADYGKPVVDRQPIATARFRFTGADAAAGPVETTLIFGGDTHAVAIPRGRGLEALRDAWKRVALAAATRWVAEDRLHDADGLLADAFAPDETDEAVATVRAACKSFTRATVEYHGGHPSFTDTAKGVLRLDEKGLEFTPLPVGQAATIRIPYSQLVDIAAPVIGEIPEEIRQSNANKQAAGAAISIAAALMGGGQAGRAIGRSVGPGQTATKPPKNRLTVTIRLDGTAYKLLFDVAGADRDAVEKAAKDFWAATATVRGRFGKVPGQPQRTAGPARSGPMPAARPQASDIRELVMLALELQLTGDVAEQLAATGQFTANQIAERRSRAIGQLAKLLADQRPAGGAAAGAVPLPPPRMDGDDVGGLPPVIMPANASPGTAADPTTGAKKEGKRSGMSPAAAAAVGLGVGVVAAGVASAAFAGGTRSSGSAAGGSGGGGTMDLDHDGRPDAVAIDADGDGDIDAVGADRDGDGRVDAVAIDRDGDGQVDAVGLDQDGDGDVDAVGVDRDGDGDVDAVGVDRDGDGDVDALAVDTDDDGRVDGLAMDTDDDGTVDAVAMDHDGDGDVDALAVDSDDDGEVDALAVDTDDDGEIDAVAELDDDADDGGDIADADDWGGDDFDFEA